MMVNPVKYQPKIAKRDHYGKSVVKYIVMDCNGFNIGEFDTKLPAMELHFRNHQSKVYKFLIYELLK